MSRHTFALSLLFSSLASLLLLTPVSGQPMYPSSPRALTSFTNHGFYCLFDYDYFDYSDYDYNDYSYVAAPAHPPSPQASASSQDGSDENRVTVPTSPVDLHGYRCAEAPVQDASGDAGMAEDIIHYGCAGYGGIDEAQRAERRDIIAPEACFGYDYSDCFGEMHPDDDLVDYNEYSCGGPSEQRLGSPSAARLQRPVSPQPALTGSTRAFDPRGLLAQHDAVYDEAVYGKDRSTPSGHASSVSGVEQYQTFYIGVPFPYADTYADRCLGAPWDADHARLVAEPARIDPLVESAVRQTATRIGELTRGLTAEILAMQPSALEAVRSVTRFGTGAWRSSTRHRDYHDLSGSFGDNFAVSLGVVGTGVSPRIQRKTAQSQRLMMLEAAEALDDMSSLLSDAATRLRGLAGADAYR